MAWSSVGSALGFLMLGPQSGTVSYQEILGLRLMGTIMQRYCLLKNCQGLCCTIYCSLQPLSNEVRSLLCANSVGGWTWIGWRNRFHSVALCRCICSSLLTYVFCQASGYRINLHLWPTGDRVSLLWHRWHRRPLPGDRLQRLEEGRTVSVSNCRSPQGGHPSFTSHTWLAGGPVTKSLPPVRHRQRVRQGALFIKSKVSACAIHVSALYSTARCRFIL